MVAFTSNVHFFQESAHRENFCYWSILIGRAGRSEDGCSRFKKLNPNQRLTNDISIKFQPNRMKIDDVSLL